MAINNFGYSFCTHCGAEFRLFTIFNRDMQGLAKAWKRRHEHGCAKRTPAQRLQWAKRYAGKDKHESSIVVDLNNSGFRSAEAA